jgi:hypothetical protein
MPEYDLMNAYLFAPPAMNVDGLQVKPLAQFLDEYEMEMASMLSDARSEYETAYGLWSRFAGDLPERVVDGRKRLTAEAATTIGRYAREAAESFGWAGFCRDPHLWAAWLMAEHATLSDVVVREDRRRRRMRAAEARRADERKREH